MSLPLLSKPAEHSDILIAPDQTLLQTHQLAAATHTTVSIIFKKKRFIFYDFIFQLTVYYRCNAFWHNQVELMVSNSLQSLF